MDRLVDGLGPVVPVGIAGPDLLVPPEQQVVAAPGVHGEALDASEARQGPVDAGFHVAQQGVQVPDQVAVLFGHAVGKAVDLLGFQLAVLQPAHDVPAGGGADVNGQTVLHQAPLPSRL